MAKKLSEREAPLFSARCAVKWPADRFRALRHHVEAAEAGRGTLEAHLEECLPGKDHQYDRAAEIRVVLGILRQNSLHPDVQSGKRKASEIWLADLGIIELKEIPGSWQTSTKCDLVERFEANLRQKARSGNSSDGPNV
jgi:hypothetical protein